MTGEETLGARRRNPGERTPWEQSSDWMRARRREVAGTAVTTAADVKVVRYSDILRCPRHIMLPGHYREDGSCRCGTRFRVWVKATGEQWFPVSDAFRVQGAAAGWADKLNPQCKWEIREEKVEK